MYCFFAENDRSNGPLTFCENHISGKNLVCAQNGLNVPKIAQNSPKMRFFRLLKKIESKDLAENGLKWCLLLLYNFSRKSHILQKGVKRGKMGKMAKNIPKIHNIRHNSCLLDRMSQKLGSNVSYGKSITLRC